VTLKFSGEILKFMNLREIIHYISGWGGNRFPASALLPDYSCPGESELIALTEDRLSQARRAVIEKHLAVCDDCRDTLTLFIQCSGEDAVDSSLPQMSQAEINKQAARVMAYINQDTDKRDAASIRRPIAEQAAGNRAWAGQELAAQTTAREGVYVSFRQLAVTALLICALASSVLFWMTREQAPSGKAMQALALASSKKRRLEPRISGDFKYSSYSRTRGVGDDDDIQFDIALNAAKGTGKQYQTPEAKHMLARVYLQRGKRGEIEEAQQILEQLVSSSENPSAELLNDLGVAFLELDDPREAARRFTRAREIDPGFHAALFNRALARRRFDRDGARKDLEEFIEKSSDQGWKDEAKQKLESMQDTPPR
jgi:tetratricopeptide (TPR) repeat protein